MTRSIDKLVQARLMFLFVLCFTGRNLSAQFADLSGTVADSSTGRPLVSTVLVSSNTLIIAVSGTDTTGAFSFDQLEEGIYTLTFLSEGFNTVKLQDTILAASSQNIRILMAPLMTLLEPLYIKYAVSHIIYDPPVILVVERRIVSERPYGTLAQIISGRMPGVYSPDVGMDGTLNLRGSRSDATGYFIDGMRVIGDMTVPKSTWNEVSVYVSGIPARYGDFTGGFVEIRTKDPLTGY